MALDFQAAYVVNAAAGTLLIALAAVMFRVDPDAGVSRALALVLVVRGATNLLGVLGLVQLPNPIERFFLVAVPLAMAWFLAVLVADSFGRRLPRWLPVLLLAAGVAAYAFVLEALARDALKAALPLPVFHLKLATYALAAGLLAWLALRRSRQQDVTGLTWAATGFLLNPLVWSLASAVRFPLWPISAWDPAFTTQDLNRPLQWAITYGTIAVGMAVVVTIQRVAMARADTRLQRAVLIQYALVAAVIALAVGPVADFDGTLDPAWMDAADAATTVAFGLLVSYAVLRHRVVDVDLRVKESLPIVVAGAVVLVAYAALEAFVATSVPAEQATWARVAGAVVLVAAVLRFRGAAVQVANVAMPGVRRDAEYFEARRIEIYRDALREAQALREERDVERDPVLLRLRSSLGISDREHALLAIATQPTAPGPADIVPERTVLGGQYRVVGPLGSGGQGKTYLAKDEVLGRLVVLKVLHAGGDPEAMVREARAFAAVDHPNVVTVHDVQRVGEQTILVMEHVAGGSLKDALAAGPLGARDLDRLVQDLGAALGAVHEAGLVHRDVKPSNLLRHRDGRWKLADFGMARSDADEATIAGFGADASPAGTPAYMSPEQARGERPTPATDLHAAGLTISEALRGAPVHARGPSEGNAEIVRRIARGRGSLTPKGTPAHLQPWFDEVLAADPSRRMASAADMRAAWPGAAPPLEV